MSDPASAVEARGLTRRFGRITAVDHLTFEVRRGELFGLVGPDGAGKTTTLRLLAAVLRPSGGDALLNGLSVAREPEKVKHRIAYMSQRFGLYADLTVSENLRFYADLYRVPHDERPARLERLFLFSGLGPFRDRLAGRLSGGMKQKLGLSCALVHQPEILLLDEPTFGVDPVSRRDLWLIVHEMVAAGVTVIASTAYMDEAERMDRIAMLDGGRLAAVDAPEALQRGLTRFAGGRRRHGRAAGAESGRRGRGEAAVSIERLSKSFGAFKAVDDVSFEVRPGEVFGFLGPNGAGKTTTIKVLAGLIRPTSGSGRVAGFDVTAQPEEIKRRIGYMSQLFSLYADLTVSENIAFFSGLNGVPHDRIDARREWVLSTAGLTGLEGRLAGELSLGWKQRLALGCAVLHEPSILFLDEPTSGVDPGTRRGFWDLIYALAAGGTTVFVTTHYMEEAEYCDRLALMNRGRLIALDTPSGLRASHREPILELRVERQEANAAKELKGAPGVLQSGLFGRAVHVTVADLDQARAALPAWLADRGIRLTRMERVEPSLEDVFIALVRAGGGAAEG